MEVIVMSRAAAVRYCHKAHSAPAIMISISTPLFNYSSAPKITPENGIKRILRLEFADAERPGRDVYGTEVAERDLMQPSDAQRIKKLLQDFPDTDVIVHCDAGVSRSAGIGAAIQKFFNGNDAEIFKTHTSNMRCYQLVLEALHQNQEEERIP